MRNHPLLTALLKARAQRKVVALGYRPRDVASVASVVDDDTINELNDTLQVAGADPIPTKDRPILDWIKEFLDSAAGQALINALVQFLIHALGGL